MVKEVLDKIPCFIIKIDENNKIIYVNQFNKKYLGMTENDEIISNLPKENFFIEKEIRFKTKDKIVDFLCNRKDEYIFLLDGINKRNNFLANFGHEIKTPTNAILGITSLLSETEMSYESKKYIELLNEACYSLIKIINDMLDYSKLVSGKILIQPKLFGIKNFLQSTHEIFMTKVKDLSISMDYVIDHNVPEYVIGDESRIKQILINLYSNSIKFVSPTYGKIMTYVSYDKHKDTNKPYLFFRVKDNGKGIKENELNKLFVPYSRLTVDFTVEFTEGNGIGLSICKELVKLMNGDIWLEKTLYDENFINSGTEFDFTVEVEDCKEEVITEDLNINYKILEHKNILLVDDNTINRFTLCSLFIKYKSNVISCATSDEALLYIKNIKFDAILVDIHMPKIDGVTLAKEIRKINNNLPIIALSSIDDKFKNIDNNLFYNILLKPLDFNKLIKNCCEIIGKANTKFTKRYPNIKVLIDEDVYMNRVVLLSLLDKLGYSNIKITENGQEAINILIKEDFDIAFIDIKTPIKSGLDVIKEIERLRKTNDKKIYAVALTGIIVDKQSLLEKGFDACLFKPLDIKHLQEVFDKFNKSQP